MGIGALVNWRSQSVILETFQGSVAYVVPSTSPGFLFIFHLQNTEIPLFFLSLFTVDQGFRLHRNQCTNLNQFQQFFTKMICTCLFYKPCLANKLFAASTLSPFSSLGYVCKVFDQIPKPNFYTRNTVIRNYASSPETL